MRAPSVVPRYAVAVGSLKVCRGGTAIGKTPEERGNFNLMFTQYTLVEKKRPSFFERGVDTVIRTTSQLN